MVTPIDLLYFFWHPGGLFRSNLFACASTALSVRKKGFPVRTGTGGRWRIYNYKVLNAK
jgi:hypothetical protein